MRTTRLRQKIKKFLHSRGEANTTEILEHVNTTMRHGTTPQQLGNVLSKDKDIMKVNDGLFNQELDQIKEKKSKSITSETEEQLKTLLGFCFYIKHPMGYYIGY